MGIWHSLSGSKALGREVDHSTQATAEIKCQWGYIPASPIRLHDAHTDRPQLSFLLLLSEGKAGEAREPSNKIMLFRISNMTRKKINFTFLFFDAAEVVTWLKRLAAGLIWI
jgi:hypothetical protein